MKSQIWTQVIPGRWKEEPETRVLRKWAKWRNWAQWILSEDATPTHSTQQATDMY